MRVTISTHNGSRVAREHNIRNPKVVSKEGHISLNGICEIWHDEKPRQAYERIFSQSVAEYNEKQTREDRKIKDYYNHVCKDKKKHPVYEMIISIGSSTGEKVPDEVGKEIMRKFVDTWKERNPNLELIGAYYHADEMGVPHVHCSYVGWSSGFKKGMSIQSSISKAYESMGFTKQGKETGQILWQRRENAYLEQLCNERGIEVIHPQIEGRKHLETKDFKLQATIEERKKEVLNLNKEIDELTEYYNDTLDELSSVKSLQNIIKIQEEMELDEDDLER